MATPRHLQEYHERGYTIVDELVPLDLLQRLVDAARRAAEKVRSGAVVDDPGGFVGTGGPGVEPDFISGVMAPEFGEPSFAEYLGSQPLAACMQQFIGPHRRLGWVHLCAMRGAYDGSWHRQSTPHQTDTGGSTSVRYL